MGAPAKFMFDLDFAAPKAEAPAPVVPVVEHEAAIAAAETRGYQRGLGAAEAQARTDAERRTAAAFERIDMGLAALAGELPRITALLEHEAVDVAVAVARKLAPTLLASEPMAEIATLVSECLRELASAPHVVVRVADALYEPAKQRLVEIARARGFEGRLVVLGEAEIALGDCRIEWADGGVIRDRAATEATIAEAVVRYVASRRAPKPSREDER